MGFAKPIEQYLFGNLLSEIHGFMYLKDIIRGGDGMKLRKTMRGFRWAALCAALCLSVLVGCGGKPEEEAASISVYYINKEETRITAVEKPLEGDTLEQQTQNALEMLAENPVELSLRTTVNSFSIKSWEVKDAQLVLDMSTEYKKLSATAEVLIHGLERGDLDWRNIVNPQ